MSSPKEKLKNFIIIHYGTGPRLVLKWSSALILALPIVTYITVLIIYSSLVALGMADAADAFIEYIFSYFRPPYLSGFFLFVGANLLMLIIWGRLFRPNELASAFLNNAVKEIENLDINDSEKRVKILKNISYFKDFIYRAPYFLNPYSIVPRLRITSSLPLPLVRNKLVLASFEKRIQFIVDRVDGLIPIMAFGKDEKKLEEVAEELKRFSVILREENYLDLEEGELKRSYLPDIFDWKNIFTGIILMTIPWLFR